MVWNSLDCFTFRFAESLKKVAISSHLARHQGCTPRECDFISCVMGIDRFIARRGTPSTIWSDKGTNIGAEKELFACIKNWNGMAPTILHSKVFLGNITHQAHPIMAAPGSASSEA